MSDSNSMINFGELSKPATVLIEKISEAVGGIFKPFQMIRVARAKAEVSLIETESQIQITDLHRRAMYRFAEEEARKQANIETITSCALPLLEDSSLPEKVDNDWITNFFDKCRIVSDSEMQQLWSKVLAGEVNNPGAFSRRTVNLMADLEKSDAVLFTNLCRFRWMLVDMAQPLIFDPQNDIYNKHGIYFLTLSHLETLGLIKYEGIAGFSRTDLPKRSGTSYFGTPVELTLPNDDKNTLDIGQVMLTNAGQQLARICDSQPIPEYFEYVRRRWVGQKLIADDATELTHAPESAGADSN